MNEKNLQMEKRKAFRLRGLLLAIGVPLAAYLSLLFWLSASADLLKGNYWLFNSRFLHSLFRWVISLWTIVLAISAPVCFVAGIIQLITGRSNKIAEGFIGFFNDIFGSDNKKKKQTE